MRISGKRLTGKGNTLMRTSWKGWTRTGNTLLVGYFFSVGPIACPRTFMKGLEVESRKPVVNFAGGFAIFQLSFLFL